MKRPVCIIGPSTEARYIGGVATHIRSLKSLACFRDAVVLDPGSVNSNCSRGTFSVMKGIYKIGKEISTGYYGHVLVNASIYPSPFFKLLLILSALPTEKTPDIHVFFHGGRFSCLDPLVASFLKMFFRFALGKVRIFHFLSSVQLEGFRKVFPDYPVSIYSNYATADDIWQKNLTDNETLQLLFVGRIVKEKGVYELLSACKSLLKRNEKIRLTIAGDGPDIQELKSQGDHFQPGTIRFLGFVKGQELETAYRSADLFVLPTYHEEGFPYVAIEAMRAGTPIISTNSGALEELVTEGFTGFKVPPKDAGALVEAIRRVIKDRALLSEMSRNCHAYFETKLSKSAAEKYYTKLLAIGNETEPLKKRILEA